MKRCYSLYDRYAYPGKNKKIVVGTEVEILHAIHRDNFKNTYFNIMATEDFIEDATK